MNNLILRIFILTSFLLGSSFQESKEYSDQIISCTYGKLLQNECTLCVCSSGGYYNCTGRGCDVARAFDNNVHNNITKKRKTSEIISPHTHRSCHANTIYKLNTTVCICTKDGKWPHHNCNAVFKSLPNETPSRPCEPNTFVIKDCNICRCGPNRTIVPNRCTKNACPKRNDSSISRRLSGITKLYGKCETKAWYSLSPCQFCYCVHENKLVCNKATSLVKRTQLGTYSLSVCGKHFMADALKLVPEDHKRRLDYGTSAKPTSDSTTRSNIAAEVKEDNDVSYYEDPSTNSLNALREKAFERKDYTQIPFDDDKKESEVYEPVDSYGSSENELGVAIEVPKTQKPGALTHDVQEIVRNKPDSVHNPTNKFQKVIEPLEINIASVLDKLFRMALRKSMLSMNTSKTCEPGTTSGDRCNMCFCLKNGNLLCTKNKC